MEVLHEKIIELIRQPICSSLQITKGSTPIPFFGNIEQAKSCTISLNPSDREFYDKKGKLLTNSDARLCYREMLQKGDQDVLSKVDAEIVFQQCKYYFQKNPYRLWFDKIETFLREFDNRLSYYTGSVVGLDLVQWATSPKWADISELSKQVLLMQGLPFLKELLLKKNFEYIFLNGKTAFSEVSKHLHISYKEVQVNDGKNNFSVYIGNYNNSNVIGWSLYLQSAKGGGYDNIRKISCDVLDIYKKCIST